MTIILPAICPTGRELILPDYPLSEGAWRNGAAAFPRPWSDIPVGAVLKLQYRNIAGQLAAQFLDCWRQSRMGLHALTLPAEVVGGIEDVDLAARILDPLGLSWKFAKPAAVSSVMPGVNSVMVELKAEAEQPENVPRTSNIFIPIELAQYRIYLYSAASSVTSCSNPYYGGSIGSAGGVSTTDYNNLAGNFIELKVYVAPTAARTCTMLYEVPPADRYTTKVFGVDEDGLRTLIFSDGPRFAGWYVDSVGRNYATSLAGPVSIGIKNLTSGQKFGPWFNSAYTQGYEPGESLGVQGIGSDSVQAISVIPPNWFASY
jgi:hypothetical protein